MLENELKSKGHLFLELDTEWEGNRGEEVLIWYESSLHGAFLRNHGLYLLHTSKAEIGSWGSPLSLKDGQVISLHKRKAAKKTEQIDVAVSAKAVVSALAVHCSTDNLPIKLISNPVRFSEASKSRILEHDL